MKSAYQILRRPVITEKGLGVKETESTLVFQVAPSATKTEIKEAVQSIFKVKVDSVRTSNFPGKRPGRKGNRIHPGFSGGAQRDQDRNQGSGAVHFQSEGGFRAHLELSRQGTASRTFRRLPS